jgi:hypothetical protein
MGTTQDYFLSWWQLPTVIIGQPNKMLRDLRISKRSRELFATLMETLVIGDNHKVSNLVFSLCMSECLDKTQDTEMSMLHSSSSPYFLLMQPSHVGLLYHFIMQHSGSQ